MIFFDANVLVYASNPGTPEHSRTLAWLEQLSRRRERVGLPWVSIWAFLRIVTAPANWPNPIAIEEAFAFVRSWIALPQAVIVNPGPRHFEILSRLTADHNIRGRHLTDAVLAALAIEHDATLASADRDFARFPGLRWVNPLA